MELTKKTFLQQAQVYDAWEDDNGLGAILLWDTGATNLSLKPTQCPVCMRNVSTLQLSRQKGNTIEILHSESQGCRCFPDQRFTPSTRWIINSLRSYLGKKATMIHYSENYEKRGN